MNNEPNGWLPATWHGRRGLWRLLLLALIVAGIGRVACAKPAAANDASYRAADFSCSAPRSSAPTTRSTPTAKASPSSLRSASASSGKGHGA